MKEYKELVLHSNYLPSENTQRFNRQDVNEVLKEGYFLVAVTAIGDFQHYHFVREVKEISADMPIPTRLMRAG
jgi:hypothetical protein